MSTQDLEHRLHTRLLSAVEAAKTRYQYNPTRFTQMLAVKGPVGAVKHLLEGTTPAEGFGTLMMAGGMNALALSVEAIITAESEWHALFTRQELAEAKRRLLEAGYLTAAPSPATQAATRAPEPVGAYPPVRKVGTLLFISGQGPRQRGSKDIPGVRLDASGRMTDYDMEAQVRAVMQNLRWILEENGSSWEKIVDMTCYLTDMQRDFAVYNRVYAEYFPPGPTQPCRTTLGISHLPQAGNAPIAFEVKAIAAL